MKKFLINILLLSGVIYLLSGCSDVNKSKADSFTELRIVPSNKTVPEEAETVDFKAYGVYFDQSFEDQTEGVLWSSSDISVAEIEQNGTVTLKGLGDTTISAVYNLEGTVHEQSTLLSVRAGLLQSITIEPQEAVVPKSFSQRFRAIGLFNDGDTYNISALVTWDSSDESVAVIRPMLFSAVAEANETTMDGDMTVISVVSRNGKSATAVLYTSAAELESIEIHATREEISKEKNETIHFTAEGTFSYGDNADVTLDVIFKSSDENILEVEKREDEGYWEGNASSKLIPTFGDVNVTVHKTVISSVEDYITVKVDP